MYLFQAIAAGIKDSVNPCAFSVLILTISFLMGIGRLRSRIVAIGMVYIGGIFLTYLLIGLGILQALHIFNTPHFMGKVAAALLVVLGLINLIGVLFPAFPIKLRIPTLAHERMAKLLERASLPAAFVLGGLVGLCEFPCTGGPYLMVLGLLHDATTYVKGLGYLVLYNLIFVIPLVAILFASSNRTITGAVSKWQQEHRRSGRVVSGIAMVALGALILAIYY